MSPSPHTLHTPRLVLRRWTAADRVPFRVINADPRVMQYYPSVCTAEESDLIIERAEAQFEKYQLGLFAVEKKSAVLHEHPTLLGFVGLQQITYEVPFTPTIEIGWRIHADHWNQGYATEAATAALTDGFTRLGLEEIVAMTAIMNTPSRRVMEKLQMTHDPQDDFDHPKVPPGHKLQRHVLYRLLRP